MIANCTFVDNSAVDGGGMHNWGNPEAGICEPTVTNCIFTRNSPSGLSNARAAPTIANCIIWANNIFQIDNFSSSPIVNYCDVQGGYDGTENIDADPCFADPNNNDFHLLPDSLCIDAGDNNAPNLPDYDFEGDFRIVDGDSNGTATVDMGIDEYAPQPSIVWIDDDYYDGGANDSHTWSYDAFDSIQDGIDAVTSPGMVYVAEGFYSDITLRNGVRIVGAYADDNPATNSIISGVGSGIAVTSENVDSSARLEGFSIVNSYTTGMYNWNSSPEVVNCIFQDNFSTSSTAGGGGMYNAGSSPTVMNCIFFNNSATNGGSGGGIFNAFSSSPLIIACTFQGNQSDNNGGAICSYSYSSPEVINCIFWNNSAVNNGGGIYSDASALSVINSTFYANTAIDGQALACDSLDHAYPSTVHITNSILWETGSEIWTIDGSTITTTYSNVHGGDSGVGNIADDPMFVDPAAGDFHLKNSSPCLDTGDNWAKPVYVSTDFDGDNRIIDGDLDGTATVDMGMDELRIIYVNNIAAGGAGNGSSWADAFLDLQSGLDAVHSAANILVAAGIYKPTEEHGNSGDRYKSFQMQNGVRIYGGFPNTGDPNWADRYCEKYRTILSGDLNGDDDPNAFPNISYNDNCYHVFYHTEALALNSTAVLDGFTLTGAYANGGYPHNRGGGMYNGNCSPAVNNCIFTMSVGRYGIGMGNEYGAAPRVTNCTFHNNHSQGYSGGGMYNYLASPQVTNCIFSDNYAHNGGGLYNRSSSPVLTNCTFSKNGASVGIGGAIHNDWATLVITNCVLWDNTEPPDEEIYDGRSTTTVNYSLVKGGYPGTNNLDTDPKFVDPNSFDFHLQSDSPCIDSADNGEVTEEADKDGLIRIADGDCDSTAMVDMGAYEFDWLYIGDFAGGCDVDLGDFAVLAQNWQQDNPAIDIAPYLKADGIIDFWELSVFAEHWLDRVE